jgi:nitrite reductase/ring-hydroxylating ferredoxin subunit
MGEKMSEERRFVRAAAVGEAAPGEMISVDVDGEQVLLCNVGGEDFAIQDECTQECFPLSEGTLKGRSVVCLLHAARFDVKTGEVLALPAYEAVKTYEVRVEGEDILVGVE